MLQSPQTSRSWAVLLISIAGCVLLGGLVFFGRESDAPLLADSEELRAALIERVSSLEDEVRSLQLEIGRLKGDTDFNRWRPDDSDAAASLVRHEEILRGLSASALVQSNLVVVLERMIAHEIPAREPSPGPEQRRAALESMDSSLSRERETLHAMQEHASALLFELNIPGDVSTIDPSMALDTANLSRYWPYFEAKRQRDRMQNLVDSLEMKLRQEQINYLLSEGGSAAR